MKIQNLIRHALKEDMPRGDITTRPLNLKNMQGRAQLIAKQNLILSGAKTFELTFKTLDPKVKIGWKAKDGETISSGTVICEIKGPLASLLKAERTALNLLGHLSGIATLTTLFVKEVAGTNAKITDTRKTLPLLRSLEKAAVRHGGGTNHRSSLSEAILVKENHIRAAGGITKAVQLIRKAHKRKPIEVEVRNLTELKEALHCKVERLLLDNMSLQMMKEAVIQVDHRALIEASGNMSLERVREVAELGVDFISVGKLTHSAPTADVSLMFMEN